ncbi:MAG: hypothetical protein ACI8QZ_001578 [Chlamydiales bacterium]|jgi:hypothetical protein
MTLIEVAIAMPIVLIAMGMFVQMFRTGVGLRTSGREIWSANAAAQDLLERMRNEDFRSIVAIYNADPFDDPLGPGTAPGSTFSVDGLPALDADSGLPVGEVILPVINTGTEVVPIWELREDMELPALGLPRDLNADAVIDALDHSTDVSILPILVRVRWRSANGPREYELQTLLAEMRY